MNDAMTIKVLVERALLAALDDMSAVIESKLVALFDAEPAPSRHAHATSSTAKKRSRRSKPAVKASASANATPPRDETSLRNRVLAALDAAGTPMSRSQLIAALAVRPSEEARLGTALVRLRADMLIVLEGDRRSAVYRIATIGESHVGDANDQRSSLATAAASAT